MADGIGDLLWFSGITWHTPLREIGWTYVVALILGGILCRAINQMIKMMRGDD